MNYAKVEFEMAPRTQRFMREHNGTDMQQDPEVRYWRRVSAFVCALLLASGCATVQAQIDGEEDYAFAFAEDAGYPQQPAEVSEEDDDSAFAENAGYPPQSTGRTPKE